jgi:hypothetical protein
MFLLTFLYYFGILAGIVVPAGFLLLFVCVIVWLCRKLLGA